MYLFGYSEKLYNKHFQILRDAQNDISIQESLRTNIPLKNKK